MRQKILSLSLAALAASLAACGDDDEDAPLAYVDDGRLTVMTRNLYLGAGLDAVIQATTIEQAAGAATQAWILVNDNSFQTRAAAIAAEVAATLPDVIGLQEVTLWRTDAPADGPASPAETVAVDYLGLLLQRLREQRLEYVPAAQVDLFDVEAPTALGLDARLLDRQVILVRAGVPFTNPRSAVFTNLLPLTILGQPFSVKRGYTAVDVTIGGQPITVFNTHLEAFAAPPRIAQAAELATVLAGVTGRVVLMGDLNSAPGTEGHLAMTTAGFSDAWAAVHGTDPGLTCCWPANLRETSPALDQRIDYVMTRGGPTATEVTIVGEDPADRIATFGGALWPSDHAGVVATIQP